MLTAEPLETQMIAMTVIAQPSTTPTEFPRSGTHSQISKPYIKMDSWGTFRT